MPSSTKAGASRIERADDLSSMLTRVPDPRDPRGVRYRLEGLLAVTVSAVMAGARSFAEIGWLLRSRRAVVRLVGGPVFSTSTSGVLDQQQAASLPNSGHLGPVNINTGIQAVMLQLEGAPSA